MDFTSDNAYGAAAPILKALTAAGAGAMAAYGDDAISERMTQRFAHVFECDVVVFPVVTGTAANCLALATVVPPHGAILCHELAHVEVDECGAPEFFTHGAKLVRIAGEGAKLTIPALEAALTQVGVGGFIFAGCAMHPPCCGQPTISLPADVEAIRLPADARILHFTLNDREFIVSNPEQSFGWRKRIGLLSPTVIETAAYDFFRLAPDGVSMCATTST